MHCNNLDCIQSHHNSVHACYFEETWCDHWNACNKWETLCSENKSSCKTTGKTFWSQSVVKRSCPNSERASKIYSFMIFFLCFSEKMFPLNIWYRYKTFYIPGNKIYIIYVWHYLSFHRQTHTHSACLSLSLSLGVYNVAKCSI